ncbi:sperm flagellar protein 2 [Nematostella vectensis]|uniref:sperm flagellar protein 2 n=1 Tax=Nematostella vectensis TaxID=45351 RepID=UPI002076E3AC|nr:sperm flagellar protein 2 [Nematostella vectensis]
MTEILCRWINDDVGLSRYVDQSNFAKEFATGFLLGELLEKHGLQNDFAAFSQSTTSDSKLNNFTRLEPTLKLLEVPYDTNVARAIMNESQSAITRLMYQLFIALGKKSKMGLTGVAMETMRPSGPVKLENIESGMYKERLKQLTKRQVDLNFENLVQRYQAKQKQQEDLAFRARFEEEEKMRKYQQAQRQRGLEKSRQAKNKQQEMMDKIRDATVKIPKPPGSRKSGKSRNELRRQKEAEEVKKSIDEFEASMRANIPAASPGPPEGDVGFPSRDVPIDVEGLISSPPPPKRFPDPLGVIKPSANEEYINKIRTRLDEDAVARKEREKRRRRVLIEQMKAHEAQEEAHREEMLVNRLMRQSQQERRIAVQLMQTRHEKEVIRQNRIFREQQYAERRLKDFDDALEREAELCRQAKVEYLEETRKAKELRDKLAEERAQAKYNKHYKTCMEVLSEIVDFSCKVGEYRELTEKLIPPKLFREWKDLFLQGIPLYEEKILGLTAAEIQKEREIEVEKENLLDEGDFMEYKNLMGEWVPPEELQIPGPPKDNAVLGHIIQRLFNIVSPPEKPPPPPEFPPFPIKACFLGKFFSGKSSVVKKLVEYHRLVRLSMDDLVSEAIEANKNGETVTEPDPDPEEPKKMSTVEPPSAGVNKPEDTPTGGSRAETPHSSGDQPKENEDPNKQAEVPTEQDEKRDKTKDELEKEGEAKTTKTKEPEAATSKAKGPKPTLRSKLGGKAYTFLKKGKATPDQLLVDIMVEAVRNVPEGTGWIMDGFPSTVSQAKLLEKALSGYDAQKEVKDAKAAKEATKVNKSRKSRLAPDPHPAPEQPPLKSGVDLVILFDLPDEVALMRAEGRTYNPVTDEQYHQEFNPPVEGSYTGINKQEKVVPVSDPSNDREQVQQRITGFLDAWPKLEKWFSKFGILQKVNADKSQDDLYEEAAGLLNEAYQRLVAPPEEPVPEAPSVQPSVPPEGEPTDGQQSAEGTTGEGAEGPSAAPSVAPSETGAKSDSKSEKGTKSAKSAKSKGASTPGSPKSRQKTVKKDRSPSPTSKKGGSKSRSPSPTSKKGSRAASKSPSASRKGSGRGSRGSRPGSKRGKSPKKGMEEPEEEKPPEPTGPPEPEPGSEEWEYVAQPIDKEFADVLSKQWEIVEDTYVATCKHVFRDIRHEKELSYRYFYGTRKDFVEFLKRPDEKQEYVAQWQNEYNEIPEDMRSDEDTKAELHQRVDDLSDRLYEICDNRKELAERERQLVMNEGWLEDRIGILTNHYITLMQVEVDRYQDTVRLLRDYYVGMEVPNGKVPSETVSDYARLPLVELPPTIRPQSASSKASESAANIAPDKPETKSPSGKKDRAVKTPESAEAQDEEQKPRIPLVPRRPKSGDTGPGKGKDKKAAGKKDKQADPDKPETPAPPSDPDEKLVFDAYMLSLTIIETMAAIDAAEQEAEALRQQELEKEKEKEMMQKKAKDKKEKKGRKSPGKSSMKAETPPPPPPEDAEGESEEEKQKILIREKARKEFLGAVAAEDLGLKTRLEMIKAHSMAVLQDIKSKAEVMHKDMDQWLGERFLQEVESIKEMAATIRYAIEQEQKLQEETILEDKDFIVDLDTKTFRTPTPPPPPSPIEMPTADSFTVMQILNLYKQFVETAPSGMISNRGFCDTIMDLANLTHGMESLPDAWMNITQTQLQEVCTLLSPDSEFIDWRKFLLSAAQPWTPPSKMDLLITLERFKNVDQGGLGLVDQMQYDEIELWFSGVRPSLDEDSEQDLISAYNRLDNLKEAFFRVFADTSSDPPLLDYVNMLMYFASDSDPLEGFLRALSITAAQPMPSAASLGNIPQSLPETQGGSLPEIQFDPVTPPVEMNSLVTLDNLMMALHHGESKLGDTHRLSVTADPADTFARDRIAGIFVELGADEHEALPFHFLYQHPIMQDCMHMCHRYKSVDLRGAFQPNDQENFE